MLKHLEAIGQAHHAKQPTNIDGLIATALKLLPEKPSREIIPLKHPTEYKADPVPFANKVVQVVEQYFQHGSTIEIEAYSQHNNIWKACSAEEAQEKLSAHVISKIKNSTLWQSYETALKSFNLIVDSFSRQHCVMLTLEIHQSCGWGNGGKANDHSNGIAKQVLNTEPGKRNEVSYFRIRVTQPSSD